MNKVILTILLLCCSLVTGSAHADPHRATSRGPGPLKKITKKCEGDVIALCTKNNGTCHKFCEAINTKTKRNKKGAIKKCKNECTQEQRCQLKPMAGHDDPKNRELDAQNREQLVACVAELRDPKGKKSGRDMTPWQDRKTPSWRKLFPDDEPKAEETASEE